jgi:hypothetical protein
LFTTLLAGCPLQNRREARRSTTGSDKIHATT